MGLGSDHQVEPLVAPRLEKLEKLRRLGIDPYPHDFSRTHATADVLAEYAGQHDEQKRFRVAGRMVRLNRMGKSAFAHILDGSGRIQLYFQSNKLGETAFANFLELFDLGDFLGAEGRLFTTRTGEVTLGVESFQMLAKSLRPLPEKYHGLTDPETRYRQRYLDLIAREDVRRTFRTRTQVVAEMRRFLDSRGYMEVETPILQPLYGGGSARPFVTRYNVLDQDFYLRIADELYLKRLLVGGFERVYEFCKDFRNEGIDRTHNPEFTMLECYEAYADYRVIMELTEQMIATVVSAVHGSPVVATEAWRLDFNPPWPRLTFRDAVLRETGIDINLSDEPAALAREAAKLGVQCDPALGRGKILDLLLEKVVTPKLEQPTFIYDYPVETSPLAKRLADNDRYVGRFEGIAAGTKFANAFSELNDPVDQRRRFEEQAKAQAAGDAEAQILDDDFLLALEHGMPPTGGLGIGVDRLVMLIAGQRNIREVILFPQLRSKL